MLYTVKRFRIYLLSPNSMGGISVFRCGNLYNDTFDTFEEAEKTLQNIPYEVREEEFTILPVYKEKEED